MRQAAFTSTLVGALVATTPLLDGNNLLPRRLFLHACALVCLLASRRVSPVQRPWLGVLGVAAVAWAVSPVRQAAVPGFLDAIALLGIVLGLASARIPRRLVLLVVALVGLAGAFLGLLQGWLPVDWWAATRPAGLFASRDTAAAVVVGVIPLAVLRFRQRTTALAIGLTLAAVFVLSTRARTAWLGLGLEWGVLWMSLPSLRRSLGWAAASAVLVAWAATPGPRLQWASSTPYLDSLRTLATVRLGDRVDVWLMAARQLWQRPWGFGPGAFQASFLALAPQLPASLHSVDVESPHNLFLLLAYELGLPGLALVAWAARTTFRRGRPSLRTRLLQLSLAALVLCGLTGKVLEDPPTAVLLASLLGLLARTPRARPVKWLGPLAALLVGAPLVWCDVEATRVSFTMRLAKASAAAGDIPRAYLTAAPVLPDSRALADWLWMVALLEDVGDRSRCAAVATQGLERFPGQVELLRAQAECRPRR